MKQARNLELSEVQPRRPPMGHGAQAIAGIQPMIPEPSMLIPPELDAFEPRQTVIVNEHFPPRKPLGEISGHAGPYNIATQIHRPSPTMPAVPQQSMNTLHYNSHWQRNPQKENLSVAMPISHPKPQKHFMEFRQDNDHDLSLSLSSQLFINKHVEGNTYETDGTKSSKSDTEVVSKIPFNAYRNETTPNSNELQNPVQFMELLSKQNQEIINLRAQVQELTKIMSACNSNPLEVKQSKDIFSSNLNHPPINSSFEKGENLLSPQQATTSNLKNANMPSHTSTQTCSIPSYKYVQTLTPEKNEMQSKEEKSTTSFVKLEGDSSKEYNKRTPPIIVNDLESAPPILTPIERSGIYSPGRNFGRGATQNRPCIVNTNVVDLPPATAKEIKCVDLCPTEDIRKGTNEYKKKQEAEQLEYLRLATVTSNDVQVNEPTVIRRVREMGISFLKPEDFQKDNINSRVSEEVNSLMWYPKAAERSIVSDTLRTSNESLLLNSAALKYLDDAQLTKVATTHQRSEQSSNVLKSNTPITSEMIRPTELTMYGIPENDLTNSTIEYLEKNRLVREK